jgi:hypothetical protein
LTYQGNQRSKDVEMRVPVPLVVLLVGVILALTPLAYVETPDEVWRGGLFDDDDQDDAIVSVQMHLNAVEPAVLTAAAVSVPCSHAPPELHPCVVPGPIPSAQRPRAPPTL